MLGWFHIFIGPLPITAFNASINGGRITNHPPAQDFIQNRRGVLLCNDCLFIPHSSTNVIEVFISWQSMGFLASITIGSSCSLTITCCRDKRLCRGPPRNVTSTAHQKESGIVGHCNHLAGNVSFDGTAFSFLSFLFFSESRREPERAVVLL